MPFHEMQRYQYELMKLSQTMSRGWKCLSQLPRNASERQKRQQARLVIAAIREHHEAALARFTEWERVSSEEDREE
jgi:hypothetical protein